jgi:hypothetical protein
MPQRARYGGGRATATRSEKVTPDQRLGHLLCGEVLDAWREWDGYLVYEAGCICLDYVCLFCLLDTMVRLGMA